MHIYTYIWREVKDHHKSHISYSDSPRKLKFNKNWYSSPRINTHSKLTRNSGMDSFSLSDEITLTFFLKRNSDLPLWNLWKKHFFLKSLCNLEIITVTTAFVCWRQKLCKQEPWKIKITSAFHIATLKTGQMTFPRTDLW